MALTPQSLRAGALAFFVALLCSSPANAALLKTTGIRFAARSAAAATLSLAVTLQGGRLALAAAPPLGECITESNPQTTVQVCRVLGLVDNDERVRGCSANENCFSTSATSSGKRISPWLFKQSVDDAATILVDAVKLEGLKVLQTKTLASGSVYVLAAEKNVPKQPAGASIFYEFLVKAGTPNVVLHRAVIDKTIFVYPLQQPVGDFNYLKPKLEEIRARTGFRIETALEGLPEEGSDLEALRGMATM